MPDLRIMRIRIALSVLSLVFCVLTASGQTEEQKEKEKQPFKDRLVFGGGVTLAITNSQTAIGAAPLIGYKVSDRYTTGITLSYLYQSFRDVSINSYVGGVFNRFAVTDELFLHSEFEHLTFSYPPELTGGEGRLSYNVPFLLVGAGYRQPFGSNAGIGVTLLYDVIQHEYSPYPDNIVIRGGVSIGF